MPRLVVFLAALAGTVAGAQEKPVDVPVSQLGKEYRLIGKLGQPIGSVVIVEGVVIDGPRKGPEGGPNLRVQRVNGRATQEHLQIKLWPYIDGSLLGMFSGDRDVPEPKNYNTYKFEGYETGSFRGIPGDAFNRAGKGLQCHTFYFASRLVVYRGKKVERIVWSPADFVNRKALIAGRAMDDGKRALIAFADWRLLVNETSPWPKHIIGREVEAWGTIRKTDQPKTYRLEGGTARLVRLKDQVGRQVTLRGTAHRGEPWYLRYRNKLVHIDTTEEIPKSFHADPVEVTGTLDEAVLPSPEDSKKIEKHFIVRDPKWNPIPSLLSPESSWERPLGTPYPDPPPPPRGSPNNNDNPFGAPDDTPGPS